MASMDKLAASRSNSVAKLEAECSELRLRYNGIPVSDAVTRSALLSVIETKESRLRKLRVELEVFRKLAAEPDPRQLEVAGASKKR